MLSYEESKLLADEERAPTTLGLPINDFRIVINEPQVTQDSGRSYNISSTSDRQGGGGNFSIRP